MCSLCPVSRCTHLGFLELLPQGGLLVAHRGCAALCCLQLPLQLLHLQSTRVLLSRHTLTYTGALFELLDARTCPFTSTG